MMSDKSHGDHTRAWPANFPSLNTHSLIREFCQYTQGLFKEVDVFSEQVNVLNNVFITSLLFAK